MVKIVREKKPKKIKRKKVRTKTSRRYQKTPIIAPGLSRFLLKRLRLIMLIMVLGLGGHYVIKTTVGAPKYTIRQVQYDPASVQIYDDPYIYKAITQFLEDKNYHTVRLLQQGRLRRDIRRQFPVVRDISMRYTDMYTVLVSVDFYTPQLKIVQQNNTFALLGDILLRIYSGNTLGSGVPFVEIPSYTSGATTLSGMFYGIPSPIFTKQMYRLHEFFPTANRIVFLVGGQRSRVEVDNKIVYINHFIDLEKQLQNYLLLQQYYPAFDELYTIDLGSLEEGKIIVGQ